MYMLHLLSPYGFIYLLNPMKILHNYLWPLSIQMHHNYLSMVINELQHQHLSLVCVRSQTRQERIAPHSTH